MRRSGWVVREDDKVENGLLEQLPLGITIAVVVVNLAIAGPMLLL